MYIKLKKYMMIALIFAKFNNDVLYILIQIIIYIIEIRPWKNGYWFFFL